MLLQVQVNNGAETKLFGGRNPEELLGIKQYTLPPRRLELGFFGITHCMKAHRKP